MKDRFPGYLFASVLISRIVVTGPAYFADGPAHLRAIESGHYVIQFPGYWLFNRLGGFFPDPEIGIATMNWLFSALGAVIFYEASRKLTTEWVARAAAIAYVTVFFAWFSGAIHSTYASQLFFPILSIYCILRLWESHAAFWGLSSAIAFILAAGLRPSDGAFLAPAFIYGIVRAQEKAGRRFAYLAIAFVGCLSWLIPEEAALKGSIGAIGAGFRTQLNTVAVDTGLLGGAGTVKAFSDFLRYALPLTLGLSPVFPLTIKGKPNDLRKLLWVWILPGSLFFVLIYIADPPYLDFMLPAFLLLAVVGGTTEKRKIQSFILCSTVNVAFFLFWRPIRPSTPSLRLVSYVVDADLGRCTLYSIKHHRYPLRLRDLVREVMP